MLAVIDSAAWVADASISWQRCANSSSGSNTCSVGRAHRRVRRAPPDGDVMVEKRTAHLASTKLATAPPWLKPMTPSSLRDGLMQISSFGIRDEPKPLPVAYAKFWSEVENFIQGTLGLAKWKSPVLGARAGTLQRGQPLRNWKRTAEAAPTALGSVTRKEAQVSSSQAPAPSTTRFGRNDWML